MDQTNEPDWDRLLLGAAELARFRSGEDRVRGVAESCFLHYLNRRCGRAMEELRWLVDLYRVYEVSRDLGVRRRLRTAVADWAQKFRLVENGHPPGWIGRWAELTLGYWSIRPTARASPGHAQLAADEESDDSLVWNPKLELLNTFIRRARVYEKALAGPQRAPVTHTAKHYEWLARRLANSETPSAIAGKDHADVAAIKKGIREAGRVLGLDLHKRGRPPKKTT